MFPDELHQRVELVLDVDDFLPCFKLVVSGLDSVYVLDVQRIHHIGRRVRDPNIRVLVSREWSLYDPGVDTRGDPHGTYPAIGNYERA